MMIIFAAAVVFYAKTGVIRVGVAVERIVANSDKDGDGILDADDIVQGARQEVKNKTKYKDAYYAGGYPPDGEGVCTDVVWRALKNAGYDLKTLMDQDILQNTKSYPRVAGTPDPNIDFRRVKNQFVFFQRHATSLTTEIIPGDPENLKEWQGGDIVITDIPDHVAIVSDKRNWQGVPYVIHNARRRASEDDCLVSWNKHIIGHFRFPPVK